MTLWKWLYNEKKETLYTVGIYKDGTLRNPNGYPEDEVRAACEKAERKSVFATLRDELHNLSCGSLGSLLPRCGTNRLRHVGGVAAPGLGAAGSETARRDSKSTRLDFVSETSQHVRVAELAATYDCEIHREASQKLISAWYFIGESGCMTYRRARR